MQNSANIGMTYIDMGKLNGPAEEAVTSAVLIKATGSQVVPQANKR